AIIEDTSDEDDTDIHTTSMSKKNKTIIEDLSDEHDPDMLTAFKKKINKPIIKESSDEHDSDMRTPTKTRKTASRVEVSTSKKRKLIIDQYEVESEPEEEGNISKANELVIEKIEPED
ncbi:hypothetical protein Tco_1364248, partial [Tanacetum coccineum]